MATTETFRVNITKNGQTLSTGEVTRKHFDKADRMGRGLKGLVIGWSLAIVSILVPILHFFLVPGFFILGIVLFFAMSAETETIVGGTGVCPECKKEFNIEGGRAVPFEDVCNHCRAHFKIEKA
jgi:hypothetical protein